MKTPVHCRSSFAMRVISIVGCMSWLFMVTSGVAADLSGISTPHPVASDVLNRGGSSAQGTDSSSVRPAPITPAEAPSDSSSADSTAARSTPARAGTTPGVRDTVTVLPPVNVGGTRPESNRETATQVRIGRSEVTRYLPQTLADALSTVPGVDIVKTGPWASRLSLRGFTGDRVLLLVDGVRMNSVRGHGVQSSLVSLDRVSSIDVMPGAGSAQYGSDALGGVVDIVTHRSLFEDAPRMTGMIGARGAEPGGSYSQNARVRVVGPAGGFELAGGVAALDYLNTPAGRVPNSGDREEDFAARGAMKWRRATLDIEHSHHAARDVGLPGFTGGAVTAGSYPLQGRDAQRAELVVKGNGALPDLRVLGVRQRLDTWFDESSVDSVFLRGRLVSTRTRDASDRVATHVRSIEPSLRFAGPGNLRVFGEYRRETAGGPLLESFVTRDRLGTVTSEEQSMGASVPPAWRSGWAAGLSTSHTVRSLKLEGGLRWDRLQSHADSTASTHTATLDAEDEHVSVEGGLARAFGGVEPYTHAATGFRAPNLDERFFNNDVHGGLRLYGNPDLTSERSRSWEVGVRSSANAPDWVRSARISVYRSDVDDLITFRYIGQLYLVPRFQYVNVQSARVEGLEGTFAVRHQGYELALNGTLPRGIDRTTGERLDDIGVARASVEVGLPLRVLPAGGLSFRWRWNDAVTTGNDALRRPAFSTTSFQADCVVGGTRMVAAVNNLWNVAYREPLSFISEPGRTFTLSAYRDFQARWPFSKS